jgi:hypothetical protein
MHSPLNVQFASTYQTKDNTSQPAILLTATTARISHHDVIHIFHT